MCAPAPLRLRAVPLAECVSAGAAACGATDVDYLIVTHLPPIMEVEQAAMLGFVLDREVEPGTLQLAERRR